MKSLKIALVGNPNAGKTSLFNQLCGLHQKTGNYPGITVEKKKGNITYKDKFFEIIDLPGTYSLYPSSADEELVFELLVNHKGEDYPDKVVVVADVTNLKRSLFLYEQIRDLGFTVILVINQIDTAEKQGVSIKEDEFYASFDVPVVFTSSRKKIGISELKDAIYSCPDTSKEIDFKTPKEFIPAVEELKTKHNLDEYYAWMYLAQFNNAMVPPQYLPEILEIRKKYKLVPKRLQLKETIIRHKKIDSIVERVTLKDPNFFSTTNKLDRIATHPLWGYVLFFGILFLIFQALFFLSSYPQDWIENVFVYVSEYLAQHSPRGPFTELIFKGVIPGISGVVVFIPQILILFFFLLIMEESGYMARVVFLMDRWFRPLGLSGKSVVPLLSGVACAIPAILSARNIENTKERLITILVTPFITCSARLPIYSIIIALIIPKGHGLFNNQGIALMGMYIIGILMAFVAAFIANKAIPSKYKSYLILDMPTYKFPHWKNVWYGMYEKSLSFVTNAGKIILAVSVILWALGTYGMIKTENTTHYFADAPIEKSYLGDVGKFIEPVIKPLGYDWKIGIGLVSSFAAREVFVGTIASIYSMEDDGGENLKLKELMKRDVNLNTGKPTFNLASGVSILFFYAFAMQCISTLAVVKKETNSWKWPILQFVIMFCIAYSFAFAAYQILS